MKDPHLENAEIVVKKRDLARWAWMVAFVAFASMVVFMAIWAEAPKASPLTNTVNESQAAPSAQPEAKSSQREASTAQVEPPKAVIEPVTNVHGFMARVGAFSDVECGSDWRDLHEPKAGQIALNYRKYGRATHVYIPAFDKTYRVVGNTFCNHDCEPYDAEIWFGEDQDAAFAFGTKNLLINLID